MELQKFQSIPLFLGRALMGSMFAISTKSKVSDVKGFAEKNNLPHPVGYMVVATEGLSAFALLTGIFPRLASLSIMALMTGTMYKHIVKWKDPYWAQEGGWEYDLTWFTLASILLTTGPGRLTLPRLFK
jgi:uncharacterized membrane protein YphA (DoxX/SURF4 family)